MKNSSHVLEVVDMLCVESLVRSKSVYLHTYLGLLRSRLCQELGNRFNCCIKNSRRSETFKWSLKVTNESTCGCKGSKKEIIHGLRAV